MPVIIVICLIPLLIGVLVEYVVCRFTGKKILRLLPPVIVLIVTAIVAAVRFFGWSAEHGGENAPLDTLLLIPGVPAALLLAGLTLGWRLWRRLWKPRVIKDRKKE